MQLPNAFDVDKFVRENFPLEREDIVKWLSSTARPGNHKLQGILQALLKALRSTETNPALDAIELLHGWRLAPFVWGLLGKHQPDRWEYLLQAKSEREEKALLARIEDSPEVAVAERAFRQLEGGHRDLVARRLLERRLQ